MWVTPLINKFGYEPENHFHDWRLILSTWYILISSFFFSFSKVSEENFQDTSQGICVMFFFIFLLCIDEVSFRGTKFLLNWNCKGTHESREIPLVNSEVLGWKTIVFFTQEPSKLQTLKKGAIYISCFQNKGEKLRYFQTVIKKNI